MKYLLIFLLLLLCSVLFAQDTTLTDVLVTKESYEKKILILEEDKYSLKYLEKVKDTLVKRRILKSDVYLLQKKGEKPVLYSRNKIKRHGDYFILDKTGIYIGLNTGVGSSRWIRNKNGDTVRYNTGNESFSIGLELGFRIYFNTKAYKYTHGVRLGIRTDGVVGNRVGIVAPNILFGYTGVYKLNSTQAIDFGLSAGPTFFIDNVREDYYIPLPIFSVPVNEGITGVVSIKYRFKHLSTGLEFLYMNGKSKGFGTNTAERQSLSLSLGWFF